jgi:hypothetical protein
MAAVLTYLPSGRGCGIGGAHAGEFPRHGRECLLPKAKRFARGVVMSDSVELIPQPHGGALRPFPPRGAVASSWKRARKEALTALRDMTPAGVTKLQELIGSEDDRVAMVAVKELLDRTLGKPSDTPQSDDETAGVVDLSALSPVDRLELSAALATIKRITGRGPGALPIG